MSLTATEEALVRQLLDQQAALLSLAGNESTITSKLGATKVTLADLVAASTVGDTDLLLMRQGTTDKSVTAKKFKDTLQMFQQVGTDAVIRTLVAKGQDFVSIFDFMTEAQITAVKAGTSTADLTVPAANAVATGKKVYLPGGTYLMNLDIQNRTIIYGDGATKTIVKPYNPAKGAMVYTFSAMTSPGGTSYWNYHSEVHGIGFRGTSRVGVGFTFGGTDPTVYSTNAEFANNVKFYGCLFQSLEKGLQFPFGNIGTEVYSCGFQDNKYGVYSINNKAGGNGMHAGNKYFYGGEFDANECGVYIHNTMAGFGAFEFTGTIFEFNLVNGYVYTNVATIVPMVYRGCWNEGSGAVSSGPATVTIDQWTGSVRSTQTLNKRSWIFDGNNATHVFDGGFFTDVYVKGSYIQVFANNVNANTDAGNSGAPCTVDSDTSFIQLRDPTHIGKLPQGANIVNIGRITSTNPQLDSFSIVAGNRPFITTARSSKIANYGPSRVFSASGTTAINTGGGSFNLTGTVVSDGRIYSQCNEFSQLAFANGQFTRLTTPDSAITTTAGYYIFTLDVKMVSGQVNFYWWDRNTVQMAIQMQCPTVGRWYSFAAIAYSPGGQSMYLDIGGTGGDATWRMSAMQMHRFDTLEQAQSFLMSGVFAES